jgi:hypothetical protein
VEVKKVKEEDHNNPFSWLGSLGHNKKAYWLILAILAAVEIGLGISIFFR